MVVVVLLVRLNLLDILGATIPARRRTVKVGFQTWYGSDKQLFILMESYQSRKPTGILKPNAHASA